MKKVDILPGSKFGSLVVVREVDRIPVGKELRRAVEVLCSCGNNIVVRYNSLVTGNTTSCGCKFKRRVSLLLSGLTTCPCKARSGFSSSRPATLYLIRFNLQCGSHFYKYGITHNFEERSKILERHNNKPLQLISRWEYLVGQDARVAEKRIKKSIPSAQSRATMPDGWTETFDPKHLMKFYELMGVRY